jgi:hypothetical protein
VPGRITREGFLKRQECLSSNIPREVEDILRSRCPRLSRCIHGGYLLLTSATRVGSRLIAMKHRRRRRRHGPCEHCPGSPHQQLRANESKPPPLARPDWPSFSSGGLHRLIDVQLPPGHLPIEGQLSRTPAPWPTAAPRSDRGGLSYLDCVEGCFNCPLKFRFRYFSHSHCRFRCPIVVPIAVFIVITIVTYIVFPSCHSGCHPGCQLVLVTIPLYLEMGIWDWSPTITL